ncbi:M14 family metallopeptidase [Fimbriimonas ginsengisoli]|uniref:Peptidase M14, carboxypeptidase A n=1 Tax=Fimbriimonas ginsengisoli Gsoil 348 TaxID=661478 RepID=A0A068NSH2_FIMGI|nr:M14 family metallopeptidase [Fimbriimonas ginsengisoli]AIE86391.1 Peptidase M14, carboxypeptidase A [Fimbriimonas ginsengisoli Gsoil 348]
MSPIAFDRYYGYDELSALLHDIAGQNPEFVEVSSIGKSHEGREIWLLTITDARKGPASEKPAFWCDGNIHASELSASTAVLKLVQKLLDPPHEILTTHTFYLVPRLNPDGAEWAMETPPRLIRSSTRPYPYDEEDPYGLEPKDLDGDGQILQMRIKDANGAWAISEEEPRLLRRREPTETGGTYYRLMQEGILHNFDGLTMRPRNRKEGLDMNRNFPSAWRLEHEQAGSGPFPTSEPEIRAAVQAVVDRPNICGAVTFHTYSGVHLRPPSRMPDDDIPAEDLWVYKTIGDKGFEMTGYPAISNYHEFRYHPKQVITGVFDDWMYEHRGVFAWTTEIWSPQRQAGITDYKYIEWFRTHPFSDDLKMLKWSDEKLDGKGYLPWREFHHPQLGAVELGGWDAYYAFRNPPPQFLEAEVSPLADWVIWQAACSPRLTLLDAQTEVLGEGAWKLRVAVQNVGWLPTHVTSVAQQRKLCRGVVAEITKEGEPVDGAGERLPAWLAAGELREEGGQLAGWSHVTAGGQFFGGSDSTDDIAVFEWVVRLPGVYHIAVRHERAGTVRAELGVM